MTKASGSEKRLRAAMVAIRLLPSEAAAIKAGAERAGQSVGSYMRYMALGTAGPRAARRPPVEKVELARILGELGRIGSNVNQLARRTNIEGSLRSEDPLSAMQRDLKVMRDALLVALGRRL